MEIRAVGRMSRRPGPPARRATAAGPRRSRRAGVASESETASDPSVAAASAALVHVSDSEPGIRRQKRGKGFRYLGPDNLPIEDSETIARLRALAIPPAWTDVWICPLPVGHIQATGRDQKGRKQYRYHPEWTARRDEAKFSSLLDFASALQKLRARVEGDLRRRGVSRERVVASMVRLLESTLIRIGNEAYARENGSYGLTTLRSRHVEIEGSKLLFSFAGKSGRQWRLKLSDRRILSVIRSVQELPGQRLFQYVDEDGEPRQIHSHDVNDYIRETIGADFTSKHFRTWGATIDAAYRFAAVQPPESQRERIRLTNQVIDTVASRLRNTRTVCRRCYIHPKAIESWTEGRLGDEIADLRRRFPRALKGLDAEESIVFRWLRQNEV